jgi:serine/threonine-protein kinase
LRETLDRIQRLSVSRYTDVVPITAVAPTLPPWIVRIVERGMEMDVARRYQTPGEMLADLKRAKARLVDPQRFGDANGQAGGDMAAPTGKTGSGFDVPVARPKHRKTVMVVESNAMMQDIFRQAFHDTGYHVLVTSDPLRALEFFAEDRNAAQCLVFCSADLGQPAVEAFNRFAEDPGVEHVPAVLLLGKDQTAWQSQVKQAPHRVAVASPMRVRQLREMVARLVPPDDAA